MSRFEKDSQPPWQVSGVRGKIVSAKRQYDYHGVGPDGCEIAAVWFDTRTGAGLKDAHALCHAVNSVEALEARVRELEEVARQGLALIEQYAEFFCDEDFDPVVDLLRSALSGGRP